MEKHTSKGTHTNPGSLMADVSQKFGAQSQSFASMLTLEQYASLKTISIQAAWQHVRNGLVFARFEGEEVYIYLQNPPAQDVQEKKRTSAALPAPLDLPSQKQNLALAANSPSELSLLIDHLSLAKEENLELIRFTQSTLAEMRQTYDASAKIKEQALTDEQKRTSALEEKLAHATTEIANLKQQIEDLKMLEIIQREQSGP